MNVNCVHLNPARQITARRGTATGCVYDVKQIVGNLERRNVPESSIAPLPTLASRRGGGAASSTTTPDTATMSPELLATLTQLQQENALLRQEADNVILPCVTWREIEHWNMHESSWVFAETGG